MNPFERDWAKADSKIEVEVKGKVEVEIKSKPTTPKAYADITVVFDRSASMATMKQAVIDGFNKHLSEMREKPGDNRWTMVCFDDPSSAKGAGESFPQTVFENKAEKEVPLLTSGNFIPRGTTALVDALCTTIQRTKLRTSGKDDHVKSIMMIVTDGEENSSVEFNSNQMREMIAEAQTKHGFQFIYLGANQDAFSVAGRAGMSTHSFINGMTGGALVAPPPGLSAGSTPVNTYVPTYRGMCEAIGSGLVGAFSVASGSAGTGTKLF